MAIHKLTRSPRRAQPNSTSARTREAARKHLVAGLPVYENLYALNRDFEQVLAHLARLQELGAFQERDLGNILSVIVREMRAWANLELVKALQTREPEDRAQFGGLLIEAARLLEERKAAGKEGQRKRGRAKSEGV
jgi:hypothetical protein